MEVDIDGLICPRSHDAGGGTRIQNLGCPSDNESQFILVVTGPGSSVGANTRNQLFLNDSGELSCPPGRHPNHL
jgi:hypothetical protein